MYVSWMNSLGMLFPRSLLDVVKVGVYVIGILGIVFGHSSVKSVIAGVNPWSQSIFKWLPRPNPKLKKFPDQMDKDGVRLISKEELSFHKLEVDAMLRGQTIWKWEEDEAMYKSNEGQKLCWLLPGFRSILKNLLVRDSWCPLSRMSM